MNNRERMITGYLYDANSDPELIDARARAKGLCFKYNHLSPEKMEERQAVIRELFGKAGATFCIEPNLFVDYGFNIEIGNKFYSNHNLVILDVGKVTFGENVMVGPNCAFLAATHPLDPQMRREEREYGLPITVGNNVWFGGGVTVLPGATIGDDSVIGAGSVVAKDVPAGVVAVGNPCRILRRLEECVRDKYRV